MATTVQWTSFAYGIIAGASTLLALKWILKKKPGRQEDLNNSLAQEDVRKNFEEEFKKTITEDIKKSVHKDLIFDHYDKAVRNACGSKDDCFLFAPTSTSEECSQATGLCNEICCSSCNKMKLLGLIKGTRVRLDICMYVISSEDVTRVILKLFRRGVYIRIILDKQMSMGARNSKVKLFLREHIPVKLIEGQNEEIMHNKFAIIDQDTLVTGSFNWTKRGFSVNYENGILTYNQRIVQKYARYFEYIWSKKNVKFDSFHYISPDIDVID